MINTWSLPARILLGALGSVLLVLWIVIIGHSLLIASPESLHGTLGWNSASRHDLLRQPVFNRTLGFERIFVINMPSRTDHRDAMSLAAAVTPEGGLEINYLDGVTEVDQHALPPGGNNTKLGMGLKGAWRAHMNALRMIVEQNITSALILEGDIDWDLRIKHQMNLFARAARLLQQPGKENEEFEISQEPEQKSTTSPYGDLDRWDMLWVGHCGTEFPHAKDKKNHVPVGRVEIPDDATVPERQHVKIEWGTKEITDKYPDHMRVVHRSKMNVCSLAYAVSQRGARRFLYEFGVKKMNSAMDLMLRESCDGNEGRPLHNCFTVQPQLFQHHRPVGSKSTFSEIGSHGEGWNEQAFTRNIRWSTRLNLRKLIDGDTDYIDLFRDGEPATDLGFG